MYILHVAYAISLNQLYSAQTEAECEVSKRPTRTPTSLCVSFADREALQFYVHRPKNNTVNGY